eukprot:1176393-Prorocentrum_minimum.AAC.4
MQMEMQTLLLEQDRERNTAQLVSLENKMYLDRTQLDLKEVKEETKEQKATISKLSADLMQAKEQVSELSRLDRGGP